MWLRYLLRRTASGIMLILAISSLASGIQKAKATPQEDLIDYYYKYFMYSLPEDFYPNGLTREELLKMVPKATRKTGLISHNEIWEGVILITGDLHVSKEATLMIKPGTIIFIAANSDDQHSGMLLDIDPVNPHEFFGKDYEFSHIRIRIDGTLMCIGTPDNPIIITSNSTKPTLWDWEDILIRNGTIQYTIIEYGWGIGVESSSVIISHCVIRKMLQQGIKMGFGDSPKGISPIIMYNLIYDIGHGPVQAEDSSPFIAHNIFIQRKTRSHELYEYLSKGENCGLYVKGASIIEHNLIMSGHTAGWKRGLLAAGGIGTAISIKGNATIRYNTIIDSDCAFELGGGSPKINYNNVYNISDFLMWVHAVLEEPGKPAEKAIYNKPIDVSSNWWGTMNIDEAYQKIKIEDKALKVNLDPIAKYKIPEAHPDWKEFQWLILPKYYFMSHLGNLLGREVMYRRIVEGKLMEVIVNYKTIIKYEKTDYCGLNNMPPPYSIEEQVKQWKSGYSKNRMYNSMDGCWYYVYFPAAYRG